MASRQEKSQLKRGRGVAADDNDSSKKPRRSERLTQPQNAAPSKQQLQPSPIAQESITPPAQGYKEISSTPPKVRQGQAQQPFDPSSLSQAHGLSSPPQDTQAFSQFPNVPSAFDEVENEAEEGVWGYLIPLDQKYGKSLVLRNRTSCPDETEEEGKEPKMEETPRTRAKGTGGYLIGRHPECDLIIDHPIVSNRHSLIYVETKGGDSVAIVEDLSSNGTFVNEAVIGRNQRRELHDQDEITLLDKARFVFRYPKNRETSGFLQQYTLLEKLGKGHFAEVFLCIEKATGQRYAVKIFTKRPGVEERSKTEGLQQEIAVLMSVNHENMLCLKATFEEPTGVYLVLELAAEGELFNWVVMKQKLTEAETRKLFLQLFHGVKYLHDRGIVHRDIKPENILLADKELHAKLADFGLAKIIGEESFTTTLCGTPSYVAPEILQDSRHRRYTRAVDIWSLGVVLYICLCGFPPFSDELCTRDNPYTLTQQIKKGRFDYPTPYWDSVGDPALDLIDRMLTVDVDKRFTITDCLAHPWTTQGVLNPNDSTDGLVGAIANLDFTRRKIARERTLLSSINDVKVSRVIETQPNEDPVKVYVKNPNSKAPQNRVNKSAAATTNGVRNGAAGPSERELTPTGNRDPNEFMGIGGKGDESLYSDEDDSIYVKKQG